VERTEIGISKIIDPAFPRCGGLQPTFPHGTPSVPPDHDDGVVGGEPYGSVHFLGADEYVA
jgi:hypothetical protein